MATTVASAIPLNPDNMGREDRTLLLFARLMEGGQEDEETCRDLDSLSKLLTDDVGAVKKGETSITSVIDNDCFDTIVGYLDMRQPDLVRGHATLTTSAYLKAAGDEGTKKMSDFFKDRVRRGTYDDFIVAFCVAAALFPIVPDIISDLFLSEGFLASLGPLMRRKWKSRKVETACLEMLNAACMHANCREAVQKYCTEWLEEIVDQDPEEVVKAMYAADPDVHIREGSISMRRHSEHVQNLAAVVLAKIRAVQPSQPPPGAANEPRIQEAVTSIEDLSKMFTKMLLKDPEHAAQNSIEGLAYASLRPQVKEELSKNKEFLKTLVSTLEKAPPKSPLTYGALSVLVNLTRLQPTLTEEEEKIKQLKAYANAAGKLQKEPLEDNDHVMERCKRVFEAGLIPILVTHSKNGSVASLSLIISIVFSLSIVTALRGQLAQQGAVRLLITAWSALPEGQAEARRTAAQALARILITTNPFHVFGGSRPISQSSAVRPLASIITPDPDVETRNLLPTFEALMALTNLSSTDDQETQRTILRVAWDDIEEQLLSSNARVSTAAVELVCNLVQSPEAVALFADDTPKAKNRLHVLVALADAEDPATRSASGGALATLTRYESVVRGICALERGVLIVLGLCSEENEDLLHRGAFVVVNMVSADGEAGRLAREKLRAAKGVAILTEAAKRSRRSEVTEVVMHALKPLLGDAP